MTSSSDDYGRHTYLEDSGYSDDATRLTEPEDRLAYDEQDSSPQWHGGLSLGLLILRLVVGGTLGVHGLQKVFGLFGGPGIDQFARVLGDQGYTSQTTILSWVGGITEIAGGGLLVLGLFTPAAAAALLAVTANAVYLKYIGGEQYFLGANNTGYEYHVALAGASLALLFTGPGGAAIDMNTPWRRKPLPYGIVGLVLAAGAVVAVTLLFRK